MTPLMTARSGDLSLFTAATLRLIEAAIANLLGIDASCVPAPSHS